MVEQSVLRQLLLRYNRTFKQTNEIYARLARAYGLSESAFWILYLMREGEREYAQSEIGRALLISRQTVNSALKNLQSAGYVWLEPAVGDGKKKWLRLTEAGERFARQTIDRVLEMEMRALEKFSPEDRELFLTLNERYVHQLRQQTGEMLGQEGEEAGA